MWRRLIKRRANDTALKGGSLQYLVAEGLVLVRSKAGIGHQLINQVMRIDLILEQSPLVPPVRPFEIQQSNFPLMLKRSPLNQQRTDTCLCIEMVECKAFRKSVNLGWPKVSNLSNIALFMSPIREVRTQTLQ